MAGQALTSAFPTHRSLRSMATSRSSNVDNAIINGATPLATEGSIISDQEHMPRTAREHDSDNGTRATETCTKKGKGMRNDGVCGRRLADHEIGKNKRCSRCRDRDARVKRKSVRAIANGCGVRKHRLEPLADVSGLPQLCVLHHSND